MTSCVIVTTTTNDLEVAKKIAKSLVEEDIARCVWRDEIISTYMWEGELKEGKEYRLMVKSSHENKIHIMNMIKDMHNYDLPGVLAINIDDGNPDFLSWLRGSG